MKVSVLLSQSCTSSNVFDPPDDPDGFAAEETGAIDVVAIEQQIQRSIAQLQPMEEAADSHVVRLPGFLAPNELEAMLQACTTIQDDLGCVGRWGGR
jgi:hypothetical protein